MFKVIIWKKFQQEEKLSSLRSWVEPSDKEALAAMLWHAGLANVKLEGKDGEEGAAGYLFLFNMSESASRWGPCMITIWAHNN